MTSRGPWRLVYGLVCGTALGCVAREVADETSSLDSGTTSEPTTSGPSADVGSSSTTSGTAGLATSGPPDADSSAGVVCHDTEYTCDGIECLPNDELNCGECGRACVQNGPMGGCSELGRCYDTWSDTCVVPDGTTTCIDACAQQGAVAVGFDWMDPDTCGVLFFLSDYHHASDCPEFFGLFTSLMLPLPCTMPIPATIVTPERFDPEPNTELEVLNAACFCDLYPNE